MQYENLMEFINYGKEDKMIIAFDFLEFRKSNLVYYSPVVNFFFYRAGEKVEKPSHYIVKSELTNIDKFKLLEDCVRNLKHVIKHVAEEFHFDEDRLNDLCGIWSVVNVADGETFEIIEKIDLTDCEMGSENLNQMSDLEIPANRILH